jgi:hypothetical protein
MFPSVVIIWQRFPQQFVFSAMQNVNYDLNYSNNFSYLLLYSTIFLLYFSFTNSTTHTWRNSRISIIQAEKVHSGTYSCSVDNTTSSTVNIQILMGTLEGLGKTEKRGHSRRYFSPDEGVTKCRKSEIGMVYDGGKICLARVKRRWCEECT